MGRAAARKAARRAAPLSVKGSCETSRCPLMAAKRVRGVWLCGGHSHQVVHGFRMARLEQIGTEAILNANARALGQEDATGKPVYLG